REQGRGPPRERAESTEADEEAREAEDAAGGEDEGDDLRPRPRSEGPTRRGERGADREQLRLGPGRRGGGDAGHEEGKGEGQDEGGLPPQELPPGALHREQLRGEERRGRDEHALDPGRAEVLEDVSEAHRLFSLIRRERASSSAGVR